jgi:hypothetical protein
MPFSVLKAMKDSSTPGAFLGKLANALEKNEWLQPLPSPEEKRGLIRGTHCSSIEFKHGDSILSFSMGKRSIAKTFRQSLKTLHRNPNLMVGGRGVLALDEFNWSNASQKLPFQEFESESGSIAALLIPSGAIAHWARVLKPAVIRADGTSHLTKVTVRVDEAEAFNRLKKITKALQMHETYLTLINAAGNPQFKHALVQGPPEEAVKTFLKANEEHAPLFNDLSSFLFDNKERLSSARYRGRRKIRGKLSQKDRKDKFAKSKQRRGKTKPLFTKKMESELVGVYSRRLNLNREAQPFAKRLARETLTVFSRPIEFRNLEKFEALREHARH